MIKKLSILFFLSRIIFAANVTDLSRVSSVQSLQVMQTPTGFNVAEAAGRLIEQDGGGGKFVFDPYSNVATNSGTIFACPYGATTGRWVRQYVGPMDVRWFGAVTNTDSTASLQSAFTAAHGKTLMIPEGIFISAGDMTIDGVSVIGPGQIKLKDGSNTRLLVLTNGASLNGVLFDGNKAGQTGIGSWSYQGFSALVHMASECKIIGCTFSNTYVGAIFGGNVTNVVIADNFITGCNAVPPIGEDVGFTAAIYLYQFVERASIRHNRIENSGISGIFVISDPGTNHSKDIDIVENTVDYRMIEDFDPSTLNPSSGAYQNVNSEIQGIVTFGGCDRALHQGNHVYGTKADWIESINLSTETFTATNHPFSNGNRVYVFPAQGGTVAGTLYYIVGATANTFQISATLGGSPVNITSSDFSNPIRVGGPRIFGTSLDRSNHSRVIGNSMIGNMLLGIENNSGTNNVFADNVIMDASRGIYDDAQVEPSVNILIQGNIITDNTIAAIELRGAGHGISIIGNYFRDTYVGSDGICLNAALVNLTTSDNIIKGNFFVQENARSTLNGKYGLQMIGCSNSIISGNVFTTSPYGNMGTCQVVPAYLKNVQNASWSDNIFSGLNESNAPSAQVAISVDSGSSILYGHNFSANQAYGFTTHFLDATKFGPSTFIGNTITNCAAGIEFKKTNDLVIADGLYNGQRIGSLNQFIGDLSTNDIVQIWQNGFIKSRFDTDGSLQIGTALFGAAPYLRLSSPSGVKSYLSVDRAGTHRWDFNYATDDTVHGYAYGKSGGAGDSYIISPDGDLIMAGAGSFASTLNVGTNGMATVPSVTLNSSSAIKSAIQIKRSATSRWDINIQPNDNVEFYSYSHTGGPTNMFVITKDAVVFPMIPVYANNAAAIAGGLTNVGSAYRTGADPDLMCVVH